MNKRKKDKFKKKIKVLRSIADAWDCTCSIQHTYDVPKWAMKNNYYIAGEFDFEKNHITIKYDDRVTIETLQHIFFHEISHRWIEMVHCLEMEILTIREIEELADKYSYYLFKHYFPEECPHHTKFYWYRYGWAKVHEVEGVEHLIVKYTGK